MEKAGLLSVDQLHSIFCNLDELRHISDDFADKLQDILDEANDQGDEVSDKFKSQSFFHILLCPLHTLTIRMRFDCARSIAYKLITCRAIASDEDSLDIFI